MVEAGVSKSYKDVVTNRNNEREVRAEITKLEIKLLKSGELPAATAEVPSAGSGNGGSGGIVDQTKKGINLQPQISASIKQRHPLGFFPFLRISPIFNNLAH